MSSTCLALKHGLSHAKYGGRARLPPRSRLFSAPWTRCHLHSRRRAIGTSRGHALIPRSGFLVSRAADVNATTSYASLSMPLSLSLSQRPLSQLLRCTTNRCQPPPSSPAHAALAVLCWAVLFCAMPFVCSVRFGWVAGAQDTVTGFLLAGVGHRTVNTTNFLVVKGGEPSAVQ